MPSSIAEVVPFEAKYVHMYISAQKPTTERRCLIPWHLDNECRQSMWFHYAAPHHQPAAEATAARSAVAAVCVRKIVGPRETICAPWSRALSTS